MADLCMVLIGSHEQCFITTSLRGSKVFGYLDSIRSIIRDKIRVDWVEPRNSRGRILASRLHRMELIQRYLYLRSSARGQQMRAEVYLVMLCQQHRMTRQDDTRLAGMFRREHNSQLSFVSSECHNFFLPKLTYNWCNYRELNLDYRDAANRACST